MAHKDKKTKMQLTIGIYCTRVPNYAGPNQWFVM